MSGTCLRIPSQDKLRLRALRVKVVDRRGNSCDSLSDGAGVACTATRRLSTARRIVDCLGCGAWIGIEDFIDDRNRCTVTRRFSSPAGTKDVDAWTTTLLNLTFERDRKSAANEERKLQKSGQHVFSFVGTEQLSGAGGRQILRSGLVS